MAHCCCTFGEIYGLKQCLQQGEKDTSKTHGKVTYSALAWEKWKSHFKEQATETNKVRDQFTLEEGKQLLGLQDWELESLCFVFFMDEVLGTQHLPLYHVRPAGVHLQ
jgi:hypothetical protein